MKTAPKYTKVLTLGSSHTENALSGERIQIQEKLDGSQFRFGINEDGEIVTGSKGVDFVNGRPVEGMFLEGHNYIMSIEGLLKEYFEPDTYFYAEYFKSPKHNTLKYDRIPTNHICLFDVMENGSWVGRKELEAIAKTINVDVVPILHEGTLDKEKILEMAKNTPSYLGGEKAEGVVIKNYDQHINLGGMIFPLFTKYVREGFKERHKVTWAAEKWTVQKFIDGFKTQARWEKAYQHLRDEGEIEHQPRDIGKLMKYVQKDIVEEEKDSIKDELYKHFIKDIIRRSTSGLPEWYKEKLVKDNVSDENNQETE